MPYPTHDSGLFVSRPRPDPVAGKRLLSILSGIMLTASFAPSGLAWLAWLALIPLLRALHKETPSRAFRLGFLTGITHYLTLIYWILVVLEHYGGLNIFASAGVLGLFCLYLSLYPAVFSLLVSNLRGYPFSPFLLASVWVGLEFGRATLLTGFPWCLLGHSQYPYLTLIQVSGLVGVYGLSFLIVLSNLILYVVFFDRRLDGKRSLKWELIVAPLLLSATLAYGQMRLRATPEAEKGPGAVKAAVIQANIDQSVKWDPSYQESTVRIYERLTRSTGAFGPDLTVWPETAVPFFFQDPTPLSRRVTDLPREMKTELILGSPAYRPDQHGTSYLNRAYLLSPGGEVRGYYDKVHLVPFGEYVPMKRFLPFFHRLVPAAGDFIRGRRVTPLKASSLSAGVLICFEIIFPELARQQTRAGAGVLVNLTNDAWFGPTGAPYQHLSMAVFRAVENRRPLIRAANTGISAFIDSSGRIIEQSDIFTKAVLTGEIRPGPTSQTLYTRYGDLFAIALSVISLVTTIYVLCYKKSFIKL